MTVRALLLLVGLIHIGNGLWMVIAPGDWYAAVPGVASTGPANPHFIVDIGLAFAASGAGLLVGLRRGAAAFAVAGVVWPMLHALFHAWSWLHQGVPADARTAAAEVTGVFVIAVLGLWLAVLRWREERDAS